MTKEMIEITNKDETTTKILQKKHFRYLEKEQNRYYNPDNENNNEYHYFCKFAGMRDRIVISEDTYNDIKKQFGMEN